MMPKKNFDSVEYLIEIRNKIRTKHEIKEDTGCWIWQGAIQPSGYGHMRFRGGDTGVHRISFIVFKGEIESNMIVRHTCHNKSCVNPDHLEIGTQSDNIQDTVKAGFFNKPKGSAKPNAKLDEQKVKDIRWAWEEDWQKEELQFFLDEMADTYGVSKFTISNVIRYRSWKHVQPENPKAAPKKKKVELSWYDREFMKKLEEKSEIDIGTGCWNWQGEINEKNGHPMEKYRGLVQGVELVAYQIHNNTLDSHFLWKTCSNKICVNPEHIKSSKTHIDYLAHTPDNQITSYHLERLAMEVINEYRKKCNIKPK